MIKARKSQRQRSISDLAFVVYALNGGHDAAAMRDAAFEVKSRSQEAKFEDFPIENYIEPARTLRTKLRQMVDSWLATPETDRDPEDYLKKKNLARRVADFYEWSRKNEDVLLMLGSPQSSFCFPDDLMLTAEIEAFRLFLVVVRSDLSIGRCALTRCGKYFVNATGQAKQTCTKQHANDIGTERRRAQEREQKISRVLVASEKWQKTNQKEEWQSWVARQAHVTKRFITTAVINDEIQEPKRNGGKLDAKKEQKTKRQHSQNWRQLVREVLGTEE